MYGELAQSEERLCCKQEAGVRFPYSPQVLETWQNGECSSVLTSRRVPTRLGVRIPPSPPVHGGRGVVATRWTVTPESMGSTPSDRPNALVAQWRAHRLPKPGVAGSSPAEGAEQCYYLCSSTDRAPVYEAGNGSSILSRGALVKVPVAQLEEAPDLGSGGCGFDSLQGYDGVLRADSTVGQCSTLITCRPRVRAPLGAPFHHCRISSTGQSTCLVNRPRGFESCIRLRSPP